jgi:hypothetical protein
MWPSRHRLDRQLSHLASDYMTRKRIDSPELLFRGLDIYLSNQKITKAEQLPDEYNIEGEI